MLNSNILLELCLLTSVLFILLCFLHLFWCVFSINNNNIKLVGVYISDIHLQVLYTPTSFLPEVYMKFIHLLLSNMIGQNVQAMVQLYLCSMHWSDSVFVKKKKKNTTPKGFEPSIF